MRFRQKLTSGNGYAKYTSPSGSSKGISYGKK